MNKIIVDDSPVLIDGKDNIYTLIIKTGNVNIKYDLKDKDYKVLVFVDFDGDVSLKEEGQIDNGSLSINYLELKDYKFNQICKIEALRYASLEIKAIHLGINDKKIDYDLINAKEDSSVLISNNVVCLDDSDFKMNVVGSILKGAKRAKCHQKNRCLTIGNPKQANILPVLKIDENDVEASHSLSSGTIDEEVLFYMNARGLNKKEALSLMVNSYLLADESFYEGFESGQDIKEKAERSIEELCLI